MKRIIPSFILLTLAWLLLCFLDHAHGSMAPLDAPLITHDTLNLLRRQDTTDSSTGDTDTSASTSPDGSTGSSPDSTSDTPSSSPPSPPETATSTDTTSQSKPPTSSATPTVQTSADPPQSTSHQSTPATAISTASAPHTTEHTEQSSSQAQAQKTTPSTTDTPSTTPPPSPLDSSSIAPSSFSSPVESAVTSVSPTLVLGDMECASDPLAQQDGRCPANYYCNAALKQCAAQLNNGMTCAADFQCASSYCIGTCANRTTSNTNAQALTGGQIAGITLGTIGGGLVALVGLLFCYRRRKRRMAAQQSRAMHYMLEGGDQSTEMTDKRGGGGKATTRLSKYNFLAQVLDGHNQHQQQSRSLGFESSQQDLAYATPDTTVNNDTHSILDYQNEFYVSNTSLNHHPPPLFNTHSVSSSSTTALRPRPITEDFNNDAAVSLPKPRPDSEAFPLEQRYPMGSPLTTSPRMVHRDSMIDTALSPAMSHRFTEQQHQHFMDINTLWDDALQQSATSTTNHQHQLFHTSPAAASLPPVSQDAWSHEDQASLTSTAPTTPRYGYHTGTAPPPPPSGLPSSSSHRPFF